MTEGCCTWKLQLATYLLIQCVYIYTLIVAFYPPLPTTERGYAMRISYSPKGDYIAYPNGKNIIVRSLKVR